jgi:renalase
MKSRVAIIGAGLGGLLAGQRLQTSGAEVIIYEKSRSLGGRCATRKWKEHIVDHGVQYITAASAEFRLALQQAAGEALQEIVAPILDWAGLPLGSLAPRFYHQHGNSRLAKAWASGLTVRLETPIEQVTSSGAQWEVAGELFDAVVFNAPWPQTATILGLEREAIAFQPNLTGFFEYRGRELPKNYAIRDEAQSQPLAWSACENHKAGRIAGEVLVFVVQASLAFSQEHLESESSQWLPLLQVELERRWDLAPADRLDSWGHRWRYAYSVPPEAPPELPRGCFMVGDSLTGSKVEAVWSEAVVRFESLKV